MQPFLSFLSAPYGVGALLALNAVLLVLIYGQLAFAVEKLKHLSFMNRPKP